MSSTRLERSETNKVIAGVCGGIAEYIAIDPTIVRVFFVVATFTAGIGILAYIVLLILMPLPGQRSPFVSPRAASSDPGAAVSAATPVETPGDPERSARETERRRMAVGYLLVALGAVFFLGNLGLFRLFQWQLIWPLVLIGLGALLLVQRVTR